MITALITIGAAQAYGQTASGANARLDELRAHGFAAIYDLDYETARHDFEEMARLAPDNPSGPLFLATNIWLKSLNDTRRLQTSLYNDDAFYVESEEKVDPRVREQFREHMRRAKALAEARLKNDPQDADALYWLGSIDGVKAAFEAAVERDFLAALRDGSRSVDRHRDVLKLNPQYRDAEFTLGLYDYVVGDLPLPIKMMASLGGMRGSKKRGIETLERVAREGQTASDNARIALIAVFKREERYEDAYKIASELAQKYTRNYLFRVEAADALVSAAEQKRPTDEAAAAQTEREALAIFESLLRDASVRKVAPSLDLIHYRYGEALLAASFPERAAAQFLLSATAIKAQDQLVTMARLRAAQAYDLAGKREQATTQYRIVRERPSVFDSHAAAERGLRAPYKKS